MCRFAFPVLKPPQPLRCKSLTCLEEGLGAELADMTADACTTWLDGSSPSSKPNEASQATQRSAPVWLLHVADDGVQCQPLHKWQVCASVTLPDLLQG